jgi:hypothetical protein
MTSLSTLRAVPAAWLLVALCSTGAAQAAISVDSASFLYAESFDTLAASGSSNAWVNDSTLSGWSLFTAAGATPSSYAADTGSSNAGAFKSFGDTGSAERAFGGVGSGGSYFGSPASGSLAGWISVAFANDTGASLAGFSLTFAGEQWRNANTSAQTMALSYGLGNSFDTVADWTSPGGGFDWASPVAGGPAGAVDGNGVGQVAGLGGSVTLPWASGDTLWIRWAEFNDVGSDHALAIDDLSFTVTPVPEPGTYALMAAGLACMGLFIRNRRA